MKWNELPTPCYVVDQKKLKENLIILHNLEQDTGCHVLLAQKAFSTYALYPLIGQYISGTTASGLYEARLGAEEMGRENVRAFDGKITNAIPVSDRRFWHGIK